MDVWHGDRIYMGWSSIWQILYPCRSVWRDSYINSEIRTSGTNDRCISGSIRGINRLLDDVSTADALYLFHVSGQSQVGYSRDDDYRISIFRWTCSPLGTSWRSDFRVGLYENGFPLVTFDSMVKRVAI